MHYYYKLVKRADLQFIKEMFLILFLVILSVFALSGCDIDQKLIDDLNDKLLENPDFDFEVFDTLTLEEAVLNGLEKGENLNIPLKNWREREVLLPFGLYINPQNSPLKKPESFSGFHTGLDLEIFEDELEKPVDVFAISGGKVIKTGFVNGYGGVLIQSAKYNGQDITILYGHLKNDSIQFEVGQEIDKGDFIGNLGAAYTDETSGNRKHLHLGVHRDSQIEYKGYVQNQNLLNNWLNPMDFLNL